MAIKADTFTNQFKPYRKKYRIQEFSNLFQDLCWYENQYFLSDSLIENAIIGLKTIGFFITNTTYFVCIDIDDHKNHGEAYLLNIYGQVLNELKLNPSLVFKSPRGLHLYYFFNQRVPTDIIIDITKKRLKNIPVEIKPDQNNSLRIPVESLAIDPETFQLLNIPFENYCKKITRNHPAELYNTEYLPDAIRYDLKAKKRALKKFKGLSKIEAIEADLLPFINKNTNESFMKLCCVYRCSGYNESEAYARFLFCLERSPGYTGDLRKSKQLLSRIKSEYKNNQNFIPKKKTITENLFNKTISENITLLYKESILENHYSQQNSKVDTTYINNKYIQNNNYIINKDNINIKGLKSKITQKCNSMKRFTSNILTWVDYQDEILKNNNQVAVYDFLYPYYRKNRKEDLYPLPENLMRKWNQRYFNLLSFLIDINFLKESNYKYSANLNICKYYFINSNDFLYSNIM